MHPLATSSTSPQNPWLEPHPALDGVSLIDHLFNRFDGMYPHRFRSAFSGDTAIENWRTAWADGFAKDRLSFAEIKAGMAFCRKNLDWPPSYPEFVKACRPPTDFEQAYAEAVEQMRLREEGRDRWSHPAIFWAAVTIGAFDLRHGAWKPLEARWRKVLQAEFDKGEWQPVPPRAVALPPPPESRATREAVEAKVSRLRNLHPQGDRLWADRLKAREAAGERLYPIQTRMLHELEAEAA